VSIPYDFLTPNGVRINLGLCNQEIMKEAKPFLLQILTSALQVSGMN
jgi:hypothetical protein